MPAGFDRLHADASSRVGRELSGKYQLQSMLGCGGTAAVYLGWNAAVERAFAVKVLHGQHLDNPEIVERFKREAYTANRVRIEDQSHPNVVDILDAGEADGCLYLVQELLTGQTLAEHLDQLPGRRMDIRAAVAILRPIIHATAAGHRVGVIHRDIKPENIFLVDRAHLDKPPLPKILDFGIAQLVDGRMSRIESINGTPAYLPPEGYTEPHAIDARLDVWALGLTLYEMLSGSNPFDRKDADWYAHASAVQSVAPPSLAGLLVTGSVRAVIRRCLAKAPGQRFTDAGELLTALDAALEPSRVFELPSNETFAKAVVRLAIGDGGAPWNGLRIEAPWPTPAEIVELLALPSFASLRTLVLADRVADSRTETTAPPVPIDGAPGDGMGDAIVETLARSPHLSALVTLEIAGAGLSPLGAELLVGSPAFAGLSRLRLPRNALGDRGAAILVQGDFPAELEQLRLAHNGIGDEGANAIAASEATGALAELDLAGNAITDVGAKALAESPRLVALKTLLLDDNALSDECIAWLESRGEPESAD